MKFTEKHSQDEYESFTASFTDEELDRLIENETAITITEVRMVDGGKFGPAYAVTYATDDGEREKLFSQGSIEGRDTFLDDVAEFLDGTDDREPVAVTLQRWGRGVGMVLVDES